MFLFFLVYQQNFIPVIQKFLFAVKIILFIFVVIDAAVTVLIMFGFVFATLCLVMSDSL